MRDDKDIFRHFRLRTHTFYIISLRKLFEDVIPKNEGGKQTKKRLTRDVPGRQMGNPVWKR